MEKREKGMIRIKNEKKLVRAAKEAFYWSERKAAVEQLTDQDALADVAKNGMYGDVRIIVAEKSFDPIHAQAVYADVAENDWNADVCRAAAEKLNQLHTS